MTKTTSNVNPMNSIINNIMGEVDRSENRQAALIKAIFEGEVTYSKTAISNVLSKAGTEQTTAIDEMLNDASMDYADSLEQYVLLTFKGRTDKKPVDKLIAAKIFNKLRAARKMFKQSLICVLWLRHTACRSVKLTERAAQALKLSLPEEGSEDEFVNESISCRALEARGAELLAVSNGSKTSKEVKAKNPQGDVIANSAKSMASVLSNLAKEGKRIPITDFADATEENLESALRELFLMRFLSDDGTIDQSDVSTWVANILPRAAVKPVVKAA